MRGILLDALFNDVRKGTACVFSDEGKGRACGLGVLREGIS